MLQIPTAKRIGKVKEYYFSKKLREIAELNQEAPKVINLGIGSPDRPPHPDVIETLHQVTSRPDIHGYAGYKGAPELRLAFAEWYKRYYNVELDPDREVLPLIGSKEGIMHISMTFLNQGDEVLVPDPGYPSYRSASELAGAICVPYNLMEEQGWMPNLVELGKRNLSRVKLMWVNYPHMPTGTPARKEVFEALVDFAKQHDILLCHDNPYSFVLPKGDFGKPEPLSILSIPGAKEVAIELNSLSKSHNMAGWRVGVLSTNPDILQEVMRFKSNMDSGMFLPLQLAAAQALSLGADWFRELNEEYAKRREDTKALLDVLGCTYRSGQQGLFMWAKIPKKYKDAYELCDNVLYGARVFVTPGGIFGKNGEQYIRISLCSTRRQINAAIERITKNVDLR